MFAARLIRNLKAGFVDRIKPAFFILESAGKAIRLMAKKTLLTMSIVFPYLSESLAAAKGGSKAPRFVLKSLDGPNVVLQDTASILVFFTTWCQDCCSQIAELERFRKNTGNRVSVYAIGVREKPADLVTWKEQIEYNIPILLDETGEIAGEYRVTIVPTVLIINSQGSIVYRKSGILSAEELRSINYRLTATGGYDKLITNFIVG